MMRPTAFRTDQTGVILLIVLVCLAVMALIAAAVYRSADIATLGTGNLAMAADDTNRSEMCVRRALSWMSDPSSGLDLTAVDRQEAFNYFGTQFSPNQMDLRYGLPKDLVKGGSTDWMGTAPDIDAGNGTWINCVIERMCALPQQADDTHCQMSRSDGGFPAYRVSTRVDGTRGTSFTQVILLPR